jgi:hypothetical protein
MNPRKLAALLGALALMFSAATTVMAVGQSVSICHGNNDESNPYIQESPAIDSSGFLDGGHNKHVGPVWYPGAKADKVVWGDIIPPYTYDTGNGIYSYPGLNWDAAGQAIYNNGCNPYPKISLDKTASVDTLPAGGGDVTYTYVVTNSGQVPLTNVTVTDDKCSPATYQSGDTNSDSKLDLTESWTFTCSASLTETTTNTGTATGHDGDQTVTATDQATVTVSPPADNPAMTIDKTADPTNLPAGGGDVTYTYVVTNTGNVPIFDVVVTDDNGTPGSTGDDFTVTCPKSALAAGEAMTCTHDVTGITQDTTNIGTVNADWDSCHDSCSDALPPASDDATVTVSPRADNPAIHVVKSADPASLPIGGGPVEFTYLVTNTGNVALTGVTVTDNKCSPVTGPTGDDSHDGVLGLTETWSYTCTTSLTVTTMNTVTATGHDGETEVSDTDDLTVIVHTGGVQGETSPPRTTAPPTDATGATTDSSSGGSLPLLLIVMGIIGLGAVVLTPTRKRR